MAINVKIVAIAVVAVVAVAGVGGFFLMNNGGSSDEEVYTDGSLWILGNANDDATIDNADVQAVKDLIEEIKNGKNINIADYKMYDADNNGKIDSDDVAQIEKLINGTATFIGYKNIDNDYINFKVSKDGKYNIILNGRCVAEELLVMINKNPARYPIVGICNQCRTYNEQLQLMGEGVTITSETKTATEFEILGNIENRVTGDIVLCMGSKGYYNDGLEAKVQGDDRVQITRLPSWEGNTMSGALTWGYLLGSQGTYSGVSAWEAVQEYATWASKYIDVIVNEVEKIPADQRKTILNLTITEDSGAYVYKVQGKGTDPYYYTSMSGGKNLAGYFGETGITGNASATPDSIAQYAKNVDVIILQTPSQDAYAPNAKTMVEGGLATGIKALDGFVSPDTDIYSLSFMIFNGAPYVLSMIQYAQYLYPDNSVFSSFDIEKAIGEYLKIIGWDKRTDLGDMCLYVGPSHTTTKI